MNTSHTERLQYASSPSDALQCHTDAVCTHLRMAQHIGRVPSWPYRTKLEYSEHLANLRGLPVMFWAPETATVVAQASRTYPIQPGPMYIPTLVKAFCVFQKPTIYIEVQGERVGLSALSWATGFYVNHNNRLCIDITGYTWTGSVCAPIFWHTSGANWSVDEDEALKRDPTFNVEKIEILRWLMTAAMFVEQEIIVSTNTRIGGQVAKRATKAGATTTDINVVALRKTVREASTSRLPHEDKDWQSRWIVRGHWRNQWYAKAQRHVPVFIQPYIKGPEDKPLKAPDPTVYSVTR